MLLYTPVSPAEANLLEGGVSLSGPLYWLDRPEPEEASDDAVWVVADFPRDEIEPYEEDQPMGYREFLLPPGIASRHPAKVILTGFP